MDRAAADEGTLVMTATGKDHTSYGCGSLSELTFFGRAVLAEYLRRTPSFEEAFAAAGPIIKQREIDANKDDGFSNPQIWVGAEYPRRLGRTGSEGEVRTCPRSM
jgi:hypothetical protein